jgi:outer membrane protein OmpA-like peptidoglycan-associated protein
MLMLCISTVITYGCATQQKIVEAPKYQENQIVCKPLTPPPTLPFTPPVDTQKPPVQPATAALAAGLQTITSAECNKRFQPLASFYFAYDSSALDQGARKGLEQLYLQLIKGTESYLIEGFCDERGNDEYNIALGERRATSVLNFLKARGLDEKRLSSTSYGKEYPADIRHNEDAWQRNRRVEVVKTDSPKPSSLERYGTEKK